MMIKLSMRSLCLMLILFTTITMIFAQDDTDNWQSVAISRDNFTQLAFVAEANLTNQYIWSEDLDVVFSPDSEYMVLYNFDDPYMAQYTVLRTRDASVLMTLDAPLGWVFLPDNQHLILVYADDTEEKQAIIQVWDIEMGEKKLEWAYAGWATVLMSPAGDRLAIEPADGGVIWVWSMDDVLQSADMPEPRLILSAPTDTQQLVGWTFSEDGQVLVVRYGLDVINDELLMIDNVLVTWDMTTGDEIARIPIPLDGYDVILNPTGTQVAYWGCEDYLPCSETDPISIQVLDLSTQSQVMHTDNILDVEPYIIQFTPDGTGLLVYTDASFTLWDISTSQVIHAYDTAYMELEPWGATISEDGAVLLTSARWLRDSQFIIFDVQTGSQIFSTSTPPRASSVNYYNHMFPNSKYVVSVDTYTHGATLQVIAVSVEASRVESDTTPISEQSPTIAISASVIGTTSQSMTAILDNAPETTCTIDGGTTILAVAHIEDNQLLAYTNSTQCEGLIRLANEAIIWEDDQQMSQLIQLSRTVPSDVDAIPNIALLGSLDTDEICENPSGSVEFPTHNPIKMYIHRKSQNSQTSRYFLWLFPEEQLELIPDRHISYTEDEVDVVLCIERLEILYDTASYRSSDGSTIQISRNRIDIQATLVTYPDGYIVTRQTFRGGEPDPFPQQTTALISINGTEPNKDDVITWAVAQISNGTLSSRTVVNVEGLNARSEPNTDSTVLSRLEYGTPVNLIGRNENGLWVVALLPDMSRGWVFIDLLKIASTTNVDDLPVLEGVPLEDMPLEIPR